MEGDYSKRDEVKNENAFKQRILFRNLIRQDKITPTDIDGLIDYKGNAFVFIEGKKGNKDMPYGQELAYKNLIHALDGNGKFAICILFKHNTPNNKNIVAHDKEVDSIYMYSEELEIWQWKVPDRKITVLEAIDTFEKKCIMKGMKIFKDK